MFWVGNLRTKVYALRAFAQSVVDFWTDVPEARAAYERALRDGRIRYRLDPGRDTWTHPSEIDFDLGLVYLDCEELASYALALEYIRGERALWIGLLLGGGPLAHAVFWIGEKGKDPSVDLGMPKHPLWKIGSVVKLPFTADKPTIIAGKDG